MSEPVYFTTLAIVFGTIVVVFGMRYLSAVLAAGASKAQNDEYRDLASRTQATAAEATAALKAAQASLAGMEARLAQIEKILKAVE